MSMFDQTGKVEALNFPFKLIFVPHEDVNSLFPKQKPEKDPSLYLPQLESIKSGANIYKVIALDAPNGKEYHIGNLQLDG